MDHWSLAIVTFPANLLEEDPEMFPVRHIYPIVNNALRRTAHPNGNQALGSVVWEDEQELYSWG